jgi:hypothetical protein
MILKKKSFEKHDMTVFAGFIYFSTGKSGGYL